MSLALQHPLGGHLRLVGFLTKPSSAALIGFEHDKMTSHPAYVTATLAIAELIAPWAARKKTSLMLPWPMHAY
jgi:hypothetical protein